MAEALIDQYEDISDTGHDLYRQLGEAALEVLEANKYIRCKEQAVAEISKRLRALEKSFKEAGEHLDEARLISCHVSLDLLETQINYKLDIQLLDNFKNMINEARKSDISAWSEKDTHSYLKVRVSHVQNLFPFSYVHSETDRQAGPLSRSLKFHNKSITSLVHPSI